MIIRNHLKEPIIVNIYNQSDIANINDDVYYRLDGVRLEPKSSRDFDVRDAVIYLANIAMTKVAKVQTQFVEGSIIDVWDRSSDVVKCRQLAFNDGVACRHTESVVMKWKLPKHIIFELYNPATYVIVLFVIAFAIILAIVAIIGF